MKGIILGDRYELLEIIGEGGMAEVYKAKDNKLNRFVAVKILKKQFADNEDISLKFKREATAIANLSDANIVNVLDVGTQDDINYIVMEYVSGKTLKELIKYTGKLNYNTAIKIALQIAKALDCAHRNNIIHRDIKSQNIMVTESGEVKVTDFGIAKSTDSQTITNTTSIIGSAHYLSPEQAKGTYIDFEEIEKCQANGDWDRSAEILSDAAQSLEKAGADYIVICTNTMHKVADEIERHIHIPLLHIAEMTAVELEKSGITKVGLLGTKYTMQQDFYKCILENRGIHVVIPNEDQVELVNGIIYNELCLGVISNESKQQYLDIIGDLVKSGVQGVILGCTEIGLLIKQDDTDIPLFDTTLIHAKNAALISIGRA